MSEFYMRRKFIVIGLVLIICAIFFVCWIFNPGKTYVNMDMVGTFIYADGTTEPVSFSIDGYAKEREDGDYEFHIEIEDITVPENFPYDLGCYVQEGADLISINRKLDYFSQFSICHGLVYVRKSDNFTMRHFVLDLEKKCVIMLFEDSPDCYLVASQDGELNQEQLLAHFADFIEAYGPKVWDK